MFSKQRRALRHQSIPRGMGRQNDLSSHGGGARRVKSMASGLGIVEHDGATLNHVAAIQVRELHG